MRERAALARGLGAAACVALFVLLVRAILSLPADAQGLAPAMRAGAETVEIKNVVTAVLLDFRGYDTLLEVAVLMLATVAVLAGRDESAGAIPTLAVRASPVLTTLASALLPVMVLVTGHLVWVGSSAPGGAFQAGTVLGSGVILLALSGRLRAGWTGAGAMRVMLAAGLGTFIVVALGPACAGGVLLEYPPELRKALILFVEVLLTLSIGASIGSLFLASASGAVGRRDR